MDDNHQFPAVNQVMVADLGDEEMLACVLDDGDIIAWWTKPIKDSVAALAEQGGMARDGICRHRPFLHQCFPRGAWGLAAHTNARMIAASSNDMTVRVFAFALEVVDSARPELSAEDWLDSTPGHDWKTLDGPRRQPISRNQNTQIILRGHATNIPSISFCNSTRDGTGQYLVSTDISGLVLIWNVHYGYAFRQLNNPNHGGGGLDWYLAGWGAFWVDGRAFRKTTPHNLGVFTVSSNTGRLDPGTNPKIVLNITDSRSTVRRTARWRIGDRTTVTMTRSADEVAAGPATAEIHDSLVEDSPSVDETSDEESDAGLHGPDYEWIEESRLCSFEAHERRELVPDRILSKDCPNCPLIFTNPFSMCLIQSADFGPYGDAYSPFVLLRQPLEQDMDVSWRLRLTQFDRLNLCLVIAELGVIVVGSPIGRVAILTLHQLPPGFASKPRLEPTYAMRLDHLLPFSSQEKAGERPTQQLVGVAASPLQGHEARRSGRTWRLLLMFKNKRVLTYEIGGAGSKAAQNEVLLV